MTPRDRSVAVSARFSDAEAARLSELARAGESTRSEVLRQLTPPDPEWALVLLRRMASATPRRPLQDVLYELAAGGLVLEMVRAGIEPSVLEPLKPAGVVRYHTEFLEAIDARTGVADSEYRIEAPPPGGLWELNHHMGLQVLHSSERLTPDGTEQLRSKP